MPADKADAHQRGRCGSHGEQAKQQNGLVRSAHLPDQSLGDRYGRHPDDEVAQHLERRQCPSDERTAYLRNGQRNGSRRCATDRTRES